MALDARAASLGAAAWLLATLLGAGGGTVLAGIVEADAAFEAGERQRALALYDEILAAEPSNLHALVRSARLLSWDRRFDEALARYDRAVGLAPLDRSLRLERARVLSWSRRFPEAESAFRQLLEGKPTDREARLGLARTLSWSGRQEQARAEYRALLETDPADPEALVGVAQTFAWSGDAATARRYYESALGVRPGMKEADLGLAYLDLANGDRRSASRSAARLERSFPRDPEVAELLRAIRASSGPRAGFSYDRVEDTDNNVLDILTAEGGTGLERGPDLRLAVARYEMGSPGQSASVDSVQGTLSWALRSNRVELRGGADRIAPSGAARTTRGIGGVSWAWGVGRRWQGAVSAQQDTFRYNPEILSHRIRIRAYAAEASGRLPGKLRVAASVGAWDLSDGNDRRSAEVGGWRAVAVGALTVEAGYQFRYLDYRRNLPNGYFDPADFRAHLAQGRAAGPIGHSRASFDVLVETGIQSFTRTDDASGTPFELRNDRVLGVSGSARIPISGSLSLELHGSRTDYAVTSAAGFRSRQLGLRLRWALGR